MSSAPSRRKVRRRWLAFSFGLLVPGHAAAADPPPPAPPVIETPEVAISATRSERSVLDLAGNVTVIDREAIDRSGARSVPDLLRREAGLMVTSLDTTPEGQSVEARGFANGGGNGCSTLVLVDGRRINEPDTGCPDWSFVALAEIERIEVVRGPASVAYGDNAAAGVIHIFTFRPEEDGVRSAAQLESGSYAAHARRARVSGREGGVFATAFFGHEASDNYRDQADFHWDASRLGIGFDLADAGELRLDGGYDSNLRERPGALTKTELHADRRQADPASQGDDDQARSRFLSAGLDLRPSEDVRVRVTPYVRRRTDAGQLTGDDGAGGTFDFFTDTEMDQLGADGHVEVAFDAFGGRHTFLAGGELRREDSDIRNLFESIAFGDSVTDVHLRRDTWGLFLQQELALREDVHLLVGARRDAIDYEGSGSQDAGGFVTAVDVDEDPSVWSPRASLTWRATDAIGLYAGYARGFRSANVQETVSLFGVAPADVQKSESYEVGGKLRSERAALNLALYWMNVKNEILFDPTTFANTNLDRVRHRGVELAGDFRPWPWLELYASYTLDDVRIREGVADAGRIPITPLHRGAAGATLFLPYGFEAGVDALWIGSRPLANDLDNSDQDLPSFGVYDARVAWRGGTGPFAIVVEGVAENLTRRLYTEFGGESTFGGPPGYYPAPERGYVLGIRVEYRR